MRLLLILLVCACGRVSFTSVDAGDAGNGSGAGGDGPADVANRIFVTSATHDANFGGLAGIDAFCQSSADGAGIGGTWRAVVFANNAPPSTRFASSRGWVDLNGRAIADRPEDLDGGTLNPLEVDEHGTPLSNVNAEFAWFGAVPPVSDTCTDWTSNVVQQAQAHEVSVADSFATDIYTTCDYARRVICAETGHVAAVVPPVETGRIGFITAATWIPQGGLGAADALCQSEANAASLAGTFVAFLPTTTATAQSRFSSTGEPWRRVDGVRFVVTAADLVGASPAPVWKSFIGKTASGTTTSQRIWSGNATQNCNNWQGGSVPVAMFGQSQSSLPFRMQLFQAMPCDVSQSLICLEQ